MPELESSTDRPARYQRLLLACTAAVIDLERVAEEANRLADRARSRLVDLEMEMADWGCFD